MCGVSGAGAGEEWKVVLRRDTLSSLRKVLGYINSIPAQPLDRDEARSVLRMLPYELVESLLDVIEFSAEAIEADSMRVRFGGR